MGRHKGSRNGVPNLKAHNPEKWAELVKDIRELGVNRVADGVGLTNRFISGFINEDYGISQENLIKLRAAIRTLKALKAEAMGEPAEV